MWCTKEEIKIIQRQFKSTWTTIMNDVLGEPQFQDIRSSVDWLQEVLERNVPQGKQTRAYLSILMFRSLKPDCTEKENFLNYVSGWMIEIMQASALMADDIMDYSKTRRGAPCWHTLPNIGLYGGVNDAFLLGRIAHFVHFKYFAETDYFLKYLKLFQDFMFNTTLGESLDLEMARNKPPNFSRFTETTYKALVKYKTSYYTFYAPIADALIRAKIEDPACYTAVEEISLKIGELFQIQDDFLDCYGDPGVTGKVGTDIKDGKLTWLIIKTLQRVSNYQKEILQLYYGQSTACAEYKVKNIYDDLEIEDLFYKHEDSMRLEIMTMIKALPKCLPLEPFLNVLALIYRREK